MTSTSKELSGITRIEEIKLENAKQGRAVHIRADIDWLLERNAELLKALEAVAHLLQIAADEIDTDVRHPMRGYGGKTVRENLHDANEAIAKSKERAQ